MLWNDYKIKLTAIHPFSEKDLALVEAAFLFASEAHKGQVRHSGEEYIYHPIAVSLIVAGLGMDTSTIVAALLHDTVEDARGVLKAIESRFGDDVSFLVNGVTKVDKIKYRGVERTVESIRKMFLAVASDIRVVIIKLADRLHNMETLEAHANPEKRLRIARETLEIYAPLADRLGMWEMKARLEDLSFGYVYPEEYEWVRSEVKKRLPRREMYLDRIIPIVKNELVREGIVPKEITARAKHYYSLWKKLQRYDMDWSRIFDFVAVRIIIGTVQEAYGALGVIHKLWKPLPGRIKDYIALPKPNGYQSLHTTVFCIDGQVVEFQIRTLQMHEEAEMGIAAHWAWDAAGKPKATGKFSGKQFAWMRQLQEWQKTFRRENVNPEDFLESLKIDFFKDRIFVLTPKGDVIDLPEGSTPIDFAYHIHSDVGNHAVGAKANGKMVPFNYEIQSGDVIEILVRKTKTPSREWLDFVRTSLARSAIRKWVREKSESTLVSKQKPIAIQISVEDRVGILKDVSQAISSLSINIQDIESHKKGDGDYTTIVLSFIPINKEQIDKVRARIKRIKGVQGIHVERT